MASRFPLCLLYLLALVLSLHEAPSHATDTLTANKPLASGQKLVSQDGNFALGFFQPAAGGSTGKWYIGIWYNKIPLQTIVWVANREKPIYAPSLANLVISDDGNIALMMNSSKSPVWSTNITNGNAASSTAAVILDSGNLVIRHVSNTSHILWQSFDDFTDTWLPGNKLDRNKKTGAIKRMVSWKDSDDPAPGMFSVQLDPSGFPQYMLLWNNSAVYWASGNWTGHAFTGVPELSPTNSYPNSAYTFQFVDNDDEAYFKYTIKNAQMFTRGTVSVSGTLQGWVWAEKPQVWLLFFTQPKAMCSVYGLCRAYSKCSENAVSLCSCLKGFSESNPSSWKLGGQSTGCRRNTLLQCDNSSLEKTEQDRFYKITNVKFPDKVHIIDTANVRDCELTCLNNCSCTAYSHNGTCLVWFGDLISLQDNNGGLSNSIFIRLAASELRDSGTKKWWIIGIIVGGLIILGFLVTILYFLRRKVTIARNHRDGSLIAFTYTNLQFITRNFSDRLGIGSFGSVFKGILSDKTTVAVKKLEGFRQGEKQFRAEVSTVGNIQHINLIRLLGFCSEGAKRLLVYEYMPNGSLDQHLFGNISQFLSWETRYQIAIGIAKGLAYLHEECRDCIIHFDIKPENILLDMSLIPKVADFGMAKLLGRDFSRVLTTMRGTVGYLAPEWMSGVAITTKADVFSYGMMLFEIISGKRNVKQTNTFFPVLVANKLLEEDIENLLDSELTDDVNIEELVRACKVACWCIQDNESSRPTMGEIVQILEGLVDVEVPPAPRYLQVMFEGTPDLTFISDQNPIE